MNNRFSLLLAFLLLCTSAGANPGFEVLEGAAEVEQLKLKSQSTQILYTRECDQCPLLALSVTPETRFYDGKKLISLSTAATLGRGATVFFNKTERVVSRVVFWQYTS